MSASLPTTAETLAERIAGYCQQARKVAGGWMACCPAHDDSNPSLSISAGDEQVLLHCFAGCAPEAVAGRLMLEMADLFVGSKARKPRRGRKTMVATYDYVDLSGQVRHQTVRYSNPKDFKQRRPDPGKPDAWIWNLKSITPILYRLPEVQSAISAGRAIYLVEGEKDADILWSLGLAATCNPMGAGKWRASYCETLRGADCLILPDHDDTGAKHAQQVARMLSSIAAFVRIVEGIHTEQAGSDVSDWLGVGHTSTELEDLARATPLWHGPRHGDTSDLPGQAEQEPARPAVPLLLNKNDTPKGALGNILSVLTHDPCWQGVLGYNALSDEVTFLRCPPCYEASGDWKPRALEDHDDAEIANWLQWQYVIFTATSTVHEAVQAAAHRMTYHPIRDYLRGLTWDKTPRLDTWLTRYCGVEDTPYTRAVARTTLIGAVARVERPGSKVDTAPVLIGAQGIGKSTTWRVLCGDEWFSDTLPDLHDKDAMQALRGKWIIELGELATLHRSEVEVIKRYLSATQDHYRPSYGRRARTFLRQNIFVGSTNKSDVFKDETGNRRFYPITTTGTCDIDALTIARDQLWAEALHRYMQGEAWHLDGAMAAVAATVQAEHMEHDPWEETVLTYTAPFVGTHHVTTKEIMRDAFQLNPAQWTQANSKRVGAILHRHGWHNSRPRDAQGKQYAAFWHPPDRPTMVTDGTDIPWPVGVGNAVTGRVTDEFIGNSIGNTKSPHRIRSATDVTDVTDTFTHVREKNAHPASLSAESQEESSFSSLYRETIGNIGNIGNKRMNTSGNTVTDHVTDGGIGNTDPPSLPTVGDLEEFDEGVV